MPKGDDGVLDNLDSRVERVDRVEVLDRIEKVGRDHRARRMVGRARRKGR
jgi:hypothetical protein